MKIGSILTAMLLIAATVSCQQSDNSDVALKNHKDSLSYALGMQFSNIMETSQFDLDMDVIIKSMKKKNDDSTRAMTVADAQRILRGEQQKLQAKLAEENKVKGVENLKKGQEFLAANKTKEGVVTTASGLQYKIIKKGNGPIPKKDQKVKAHYRGSLINGNVFDSSYERGEPTVFPVMGVIKGWQEALQIMPVGSTWELYIPSDLAYGPRGSRSIGPNEVLIFTIELIGIEK